MEANPWVAATMQITHKLDFFVDPRLDSSLQDNFVIKTIQIVITERENE